VPVFFRPDPGRHLDVRLAPWSPLAWTILALAQGQLGPMRTSPSPAVSGGEQVEGHASQILPRVVIRVLNIEMYQG
jgi:hypothetical protein